MSLLAWVFDGLLGVTLLGLATRAMFTRELLAAVLSFIAIGILMALAWLRLGAPDVALAEAALGGGITGALLLAALHRLRPDRRDDTRERRDGEA